MKENKVFRHMARILVFAALAIMNLTAMGQEDLSVYPPSRAKFKLSTRTLATEGLKGKVSFVGTTNYYSDGEAAWRCLDFYTKEGKRYYSVGGIAPGEVDWVELCSYDEKGRLVGYYSYSYANEGGLGGDFAVAKYDGRGNIVELTYYENTKEKDGNREFIMPTSHDQEYVSGLFKDIDHKLIVKFIYRYDGNGKLLKIDMEGPGAEWYEPDYENRLANVNVNRRPELGNDMVYDNQGNWIKSGLIKSDGSRKIYRKERKIEY